MTTSPEKPASRRPPLFVIGLATALLFLHVILCLHTAASKCVTHDEIWHLPVGVRNLRDGDFGVDPLNPPLARMVAAIPLWLAGVEVDTQTMGTDLGVQFFRSHPEDFQKWYFWGRVFNCFWSLAAGLIVFCWSRCRFGNAAALASLGLYVTCPNVIAHASLVTPDIAMVLGFVATLFSLSVWLKGGTWKAAVLTGICLGLSQAIKYTAVLLWIVVPVLSLANLCLQRRSQLHAKRLRGLQLVVMLLTSLLPLAAAYRFQNEFQPLGSFQFQSRELQGIQGILPGALPVPFPADYLKGLDLQRFIMQQPHPSYLDGQWSVTGFPDYSWKTLQYKLPHVFQLCLLLSILMLFKRRPHGRQWGELGLLVLPALLLLIVANMTSMQLGIRYVLPALPLLMIVAGRVAEGWEAARIRWQVVFGGVLGLACLASLRHHPRHLSYFNEFSGGPTQGRFHLLDSNLDWGQDLNQLPGWMSRNQLPKIGLAYFGTLPPELLGIDFDLPPSREPQAGWYAVSVNYVMGRPHVLLLPDGTKRSSDFDEFGYFRAFAPVDMLGNSIDIYHITEADVAAWNQKANGSR